MTRSRAASSGSGALDGALACVLGDGDPGGGIAKDGFRPLGTPPFGILANDPVDVVDTGTPLEEGGRSVGTEDPPPTVGVGGVLSTKDKSSSMAWRVVTNDANRSRLIDCTIIDWREMTVEASLRANTPSIISRILMVQSMVCLNRHMRSVLSNNP